MGIIERDNGELVLEAGYDPAVERAIGYRRYWLGVDLGQAQDPTALIVIKDEALPQWHGQRQILGERARTIVFADRFNGVRIPMLCRTS